MSTLGDGFSGRFGIVGLLLAAVGGDVVPGTCEAFNAFVDDAGGSVDIDADEGSRCLADGVDAPWCDANAVASGYVDEDGAVIHREARPENRTPVRADDGGVRDCLGEVLEGGIDGRLQPAPAFVGDAVQVGE